MSWTPYFTLPAPQQGAYSPIAEQGHRPRMECNSESSQSKQTLVRVTQPPSGQKALSSSPPPHASLPGVCDLFYGESSKC